ncbi:MAG: endo-1,4-beta-xylanase [Sedimentisphaerales bacterium]|nr:endo-1,4-beta-xylanase [Sedimentisphaerales bacterium]
MRFEVFKNGGLVEKFTPCGAYVFGTDGISIRRTEIDFEKGVIGCVKPNLETAGLALLWPIEGFGKILLSTTCLPDRERPYNLNVEIARAKLMQIVDKREDWAFLPSTKRFDHDSKEAQSLFIQAIQNISNPVVASRLADESLKKVIVLAEDLAKGQAESLFAGRVGNHGFGRGCLGCQIDPQQVDNAKYIESLLDLFGSVMIPINWAEMEPKRGGYNFTRTDACINALAKRKVSISAGPLLCFSRVNLPKWLVTSGANFEKIREVAYQFITAVVARYGAFVRTWNVVSGLNVYNHFAFRFEEILEMTRAATMAVRQASERALKIIEISNPWGEYYATVPNSIPPLVYMDMVVQSAVSFDGFGLQMRFGRNQTGMHVRDMMQISALLDYFGPISKPLYMTNVAVPSRSGPGSHHGDVAGVWHDKWDQRRQSEWIDQFYKIALSKPFVDSVTYSSLTDRKNSTIIDSGLLTSRLEPKESCDTLKRLRDAIFMH